MEALRFYSPPNGNEWWCYVKQVGDSKWDFQLLDSSGQGVVAVDGYTTRAAPRSALQGARLPTDWLYTPVFSQLAIPLLVPHAAPTAYAQGADLTLRMVGPDYVQAGQTITYEVTVENIRA